MTASLANIFVTSSKGMSQCIFVSWMSRWMHEKEGKEGELGQVYEGEGFRFAAALCIVRKDGRRWRVCSGTRDSGSKTDKKPRRINLIAPMKPKEE